MPIVGVCVEREYLEAYLSEDDGEDFPPRPEIIIGARVSYEDMAGIVDVVEQYYFGVAGNDCRHYIFAYRPDGPQVGA
jgi:hypothetical protein